MSEQKGETKPQGTKAGIIGFIVIMSLVIISIIVGLCVHIYQDGYRAGVNAENMTLNAMSQNPIVTTITSSRSLYADPTTVSPDSTSQQLLDWLSSATKVDISVKGDKDTGGVIDIHLEFTK